MTDGPGAFTAREVEQSSHAFVLRLWREEGGGRWRRAFWRGTITHIPGGERQTVQRMSEVIAFIVLYLEQLGVGVALTWRLVRWAQRGRRR